MSVGPTIAEVSIQLGDRIEELAAHLLGEPTSHTRDELRYRSRGSLCIYLARPKRGRYTDFEAGQGGDGLDLIKLALGADTREALQWARAWLGVDSALATTPAKAKPGSHSRATRPRPRSDDRGAQNRSRAAREIWRKAQDPAGTLAEVYARVRDLPLPYPPTIRFLMALKHGPTGLYFPALAAALTRWPDKRVRAVQRIFLKPGGQGKANVTSPKMSLGPVAGGAVRLAPAGRRVGLCEGIEDGLAVMGAEPELPVWACLGTSGLRGVILPPPPLAGEIVILADADEAGEAAAADLAQRLVGEGRAVSIARPRGAKDFNDLLRTAA